MDHGTSVLSVQWEIGTFETKLSSEEREAIRLPAFCRDQHFVMIMHQIDTGLYQSGIFCCGLEDALCRKVIAQSAIS